MPSVRLSFKPYWHCSHLLCVARNAHVLSGYVECVTRQAASKLEESLCKSCGQEWIRTTEGVKPADLQSAPLRTRIRFWRPKSGQNPNLTSTELDISPH